MLEGDDLGDPVAPVLLGHVADDLVAAVVHEVDVDVRLRVAVEVEEPVEDQAIPDRIDIGEADRVVDQRSAGRAAHGGEDPAFVREGDEVLHDEDVGRVAHRLDDRELVLHPLPELRRHRAVFRDDPRLGERAQLLVRRSPARDLEMREPELAERQLEIDLVGDPDGVQKGLRVVREERLHLGRTLQIELRVIDHLEPVGLIDGLPALDADHDVLGLGVLGVDVVDVIGDDHRDTGPAAHLAHSLVHRGLLRDTVAHELEVVVPLPEDRQVLAGDRTGGLDPRFSAKQDRPGDFSLEAGRQRDEALRTLAEDLPVHPWPVVVTFEMRGRHQRDEVLVAGEALRQKDEMERLPVALDLRIAVVPAAARDVGLHPDDRLDPGCLCRGVEIDRPVERAVIGDRERRHAEVLRARDEVAQARQPVEKAVLAVGVEMDESVRGEVLSGSVWAEVYPPCRSWPGGRGAPSGSGG